MECLSWKPIYAIINFFDYLLKDPSILNYNFASAIYEKPKI